MGYKGALLRSANRIVPFCPGMRRRRPTYFNGYWLWPSVSDWQSLYYRYEPNVAAAIKSNLGPGGTFFDIGAHVGWFTLFASKIVGPAGHVYSFEPSPEVYAHLAENVCSLKNVRTFQCGIGSEDGQLEFASRALFSTGSFVEAVTEVNKHYSPDTPIRKVRVELRKIDTLLPQIKPPDVVKIDVEGFELEALRGAANLLSHRPVLIIEIHPLQIKLSNGSEAELFNLLQSSGYSHEVIDRNPNSLYTIAASAN
jgi:FkbM family methyltransferase